MLYNNYERGLENSSLDNFRWMPRRADGFGNFTPRNKCKAKFVSVSRIVWHQKYEEQTSHLSASVFQRGSCTQQNNLKCTLFLVRVYSRFLDLGRGRKALCVTACRAFAFALQLITPTSLDMKLQHRVTHQLYMNHFCAVWIEHLLSCLFNSLKPVCSAAWQPELRNFSLFIQKWMDA